jgi:hypothetical protein
MANFRVEDVKIEGSLNPVNPYLKTRCFSYHKDPD